MYLAFAVHYQFYGYRLDAAGREGWFYFSPEHGRKLETYNAVEHASGLLGIDQIVVDVAWILDGVECVDSPAGAIKRLPGTVDASYVWMRSGHYSGLCVTRKLDFHDQGIEVYMDTNNSDADFIPDSTPNPRLKR